MNEHTVTTSRTRILAEIIVMSALSAVLYALPRFSLPFGGSVTLGSMVPVMWLSLRRGIYAGMLAGAIFGVLGFFIDILYLGAANIIATPLQAVLEYPVASAMLGLTGIFRRKTIAPALAGVAISVFIKFLIHYFVGVFVWYQVYTFPPEWGQWLWPAVYNGSFLTAEAIISGILLVILIKRHTLEYAL